MAERLSPNAVESVGGGESSVIGRQRRRAWDAILRNRRMAFLWPRLDQAEPVPVCRPTVMKRVSLHIKPPDSVECIQRLCGMNA